MAESKKQQTEAEAAAATPDEESSEEPTYSVDRLVAESQAFLGVDSHVAAGALSMSRKKHFARDEAKQLVEEFVTREVNV